LRIHALKLLHEVGVPGTPVIRMTVTNTGDYVLNLATNEPEFWDKVVDRILVVDRSGTNDFGHSVFIAHTNQFGWYLRCKVRPFVALTNNFEFPWLIEFYDPNK
jgi:hypothetical protein